MSVKNSFLLRSADAQTADLGEVVAVARKRNLRKRAGKKPQRSEIAGTALVAAMIGAQLAEQAQAEADLARVGEDISWLKRVRICNSHAFFRSADERVAPDGDAGDRGPLGGLHAGHRRSAVAGHGETIEASSDQSTTLKRFASAGDDDFDRGGFGRAGLSRGRRQNEDRDRDPATNAEDDEPTTGQIDDHTHEPAKDDPTSGGATGETDNNGGTSTPGDDHMHEEPASGATTGGATTGGATTGGATTGGSTGTGDHSHGTPTNGAVPHPDDLAKQQEHLALMSLVPVAAATHVAVNNGSWFDPKTWANGQVPGDGAKVLIPQGVTVDYDGQSKASIFTIRVDGQLDFATDKDTFLEVDTFVVATTGHLTIGTEGKPVDPSVSTIISFADNGPINVAWDPMLLSRGLISHGTIDIHGAEKETFLKVAIDPLKGDTSMTLESVPTGWQVGDKIVLAGTHLVPSTAANRDAPVIAQTQDEELVITAINGNVVTFDRPLVYDHEGARADLKAYVANYSRNIVFENEAGAAAPTHERGHVMLMHSDNITVKYAEFDELGRTDKSVRSIDASALTSAASDSNVKGRYSLHIHRAGVTDQEHPAVLEGNSVWGSPGWGFVHHDSNAILSNNTAYNVFGAAFVAESGNETGRWDHNIAIKSLGVDHITKDGADVGAFDLGRTGTGFWFQGRMVEAVGNVAVSVPSGAGFTYFHRGVDPNNLVIDPATSPLGDSFRYLDGVQTNTPQISIFLNNESIATRLGLEIIKANPRQDHDLRSVIENFTAWEVKIGAHIEYTGHYTFKNIDFVASDTKGIGNNYTVGLEIWNNVMDVVVNGGNIEGFRTGVHQAKTGVSGLSFMNGLDQWDYTYIDLAIKGATTDYTNKTAGDKFLTAADLVDGRLLYNSAFAETHITQANGVFDLAGTKTDSIGKTSAYKIWDPNSISTTELRGSLEQNGYWTTTDGRRVALIEEYVSDRATGDVIKVGLFVEVPSSYGLQAGQFTRTTAVNNGVLNQNSTAPSAVDDVASVKQGASVIIDVLANDSDPDGDRISLDGLFSQSGHVVANSDGTVTYFADPNFTGVDSFYYFVQDTNGDIARAQVTVTVEA